MARTTMVAANVLQGKRALTLEVVQPTSLVPIDDRLLSVLEVIERELGDIQNRLVSFGRRLETLQASIEDQAVPAEVVPEQGEFVLQVSSPGDHDLETRTGTLPEPGDLVDASGDVVVLSIGRSPAHGDARPCVYAIRL
jgi:hypothetical protein